MKFYKRHPIIFLIELVFLVGYYLLPLLFIVVFEAGNEAVQSAVGPLAILTQSLFLMGGWMYLPLIIIAPFLIILIINTVISFFDPLEEAVSDDAYSKWVKSGEKI